MHNPKENDKRHSVPLEAVTGSGMLAGTSEVEPLRFLSEVLGVFRRRLWMVLLVAVGLAGAAMAFGFTQTPTYEASIKILVGQQRGITQDPNYALGLPQLTQTMAEGVNSRRVAEGVIQQEGLHMTPEVFLADHLSVEQIGATQYIQVSYTDTNPQRAQRVADSVGEVFSKEIAEVSPSTNAISATVWDQAGMPGEPVSPNPLRNGLLALVVGLMLGVVLAFLLEYFDESWRSPEEAEQLIGVPIYGVIPHIQLSKSRKGGH